MSLRRVKDKADSLGLLFDTTCNAFGGIIVIAVLVALMTQQIKQSEDAAKATESSKEIVSRRLVHAKHDLIEAQQALFELRARVSSQDPNRKQTIQKQIELSQELQRLRTKISAIQSELDNVRQTEAVTDPGLKKQEMSKHQLDLANQIAQLQQEISDKTSEIQQLETHSAELVIGIKVASKPVVKNLRLPKEHSTSKDPWFIIIKNGELYSKYVLSSGNIESNSSIFNVQTNGDSETWVPIRGHGISSTDHLAMSQLLSVIQQSGHYISFIVYDDSFPTFTIARDEAIAQGVEYGWIPEEESDLVVFSSTGSVPQPQ